MRYFNINPIGVAWEDKDQKSVVPPVGRSRSAASGLVVLEIMEVSETLFDNREKLEILGSVVPRGHNLDLWSISPKINRRPRLFFVLKTDGGIQKLT